MTLAEVWVLTRAVAYKSIILRLRYLFNTVTNLFTIYLFFLLLFLGVREFGGPAALDDSLGGIVVGFFLIMMATVAYSDLSWALIREAQWGTLEQLFMSPLGFGLVVLVKVAVNVVIAFLYGGVLLAAMVLTTGADLAIDPLTIVPLGLLSVLSAVGVGFAIGGLALVFKRVENVFGILQFGFIGFVAVPVASAPLLKLLPLAQGAFLLRQAMGEGVRLWELPAAEVGILAGVGVAYLVLGYAAFRWASRRARRAGSLGKY